MNHTYLQLIQACKLIQSDKATERKQQLSKIIDFLPEQSVLVNLDKYSFLSQNVDESDSLDDNINWNTLFLICKNFILKEINQINTKTTTSTTLNENKILVLRNLLNLIINQANSRGQENLNASTFINCLFDLTNDETILNSKLFNDLSNHLHSNILNRHKYCCELNKSIWLKLIKYYTKFYLNPITNLEQICLSKCIQVIVEKSCTYASFYNTTRLFAFFECIFTNIKKDTNHEILENFLNALNKLCFTYYKECYHQTCKLGEAIIPYLLNILNSKQPDNVKFLITEFCLFQFELHQNANNDNKSFVLIEYDNSNWKDMIYSIYESVLDEIDEYCDRIKYSMNKINTINYEQDVINNEIKYFQLASYCLFELLQNNNDNDFEIEELNETKKNNDEEIDDLICLTPCKKRKLDTKNKITWKIFNEKLIIEKNFLKIYSWLSILECFIENFTKFIATDNLTNLIDYLIKLLNDHKEIYIVNKSLKCLNLMINKKLLTKHFENYLTKFYEIYQNLYKYDSCKDEIYKLIENLINLFDLHLNINKDSFLNLLLGINYQIKFQKINNLNFFNDNHDLYVLKLLILKFNNIRTFDKRTKLIEWLFLKLDNIIIENNQNQQNLLNTSTNQATNSNEVDLIKTTQTQNRIKNMRLNTSSISTQSANFSMLSSPFKPNASTDTGVNINVYNQMRFNLNFLYKNYILINLISLNKFNMKFKSVEGDCDENYKFDLIKILFKIYVSNSNYKSKNQIRKFELIDDLLESDASNISSCNGGGRVVDNDHIMEIDEGLFLKVEQKLVEHCQYLSSYLLNIYEMNFINLLIQEFYFLIQFITILENLNKKLDLNQLKIEANSLFQSLYALLDKCFKNEKYLSNNFLLNTINLIINKFYFNLNTIINNNTANNYEHINKSIIDFYFKIIDTTQFLNLSKKIIFEEDKDENENALINDYYTNSTSTTSKNIISNNFNLISNFESIFQNKTNHKIRLRLFSFLCYLTVLKYNYLNNDDLLVKLIELFKLFNKRAQKSNKIQEYEFELFFNLSIKFIFLINFLDYNYISFNGEIVSINMFKYCLRLLKTAKTQLVSNNVFLNELLLKLILSYSDILIKIYNFFHTNNICEDDNNENKAILSECISLIINLIEDIYTESELNIENNSKEDADEAPSCSKYDSISCHKLIIKCISKSIYLKTLIHETESPTTSSINDLFILKYIHLITNKSIQIRTQVINTLKSLFINSNANYFDDIYENLVKLIKLHSNSSSNETDAEDEMSNNKYKLIRKNYLNNLKLNDNLLNLRLTIFFSLLNLIRFPLYELKCQFALIQANNLIANKNLFNILQYKYFISINREYFDLKNQQRYLNHSYLTLNWLMLDYDLNKFPYLIEYKTFSEYLSDNFNSILNYYLVINVDREKFLKITQTQNDDNLSIQNFIKINFKSILCYLFNNCLISRKKTFNFCENKIVSFIEQNKDLNLNLKELIKLNFNSIFLEILIYFNEINFNLNDIKTFKTNLLNIIAYLLRALNDQQAEQDSLTTIQTSIKLLSTFLIKSSNEFLHKILFELTKSILKSYQLNDFIRYLHVYILFIENILFNLNTTTDKELQQQQQATSCLFHSTDQQIFLLKSYSSTIINIIKFYKINLCSTKSLSKIFNIKELKQQIFVLINKLVINFLKIIDKNNLKFNFIDSFIGECLWYLIDLFEFELDNFKECDNYDKNLSLYEHLFKKILNLLQAFSVQSKNIKCICVYLKLLTKSNYVKKFFNEQNISLLDIPSTVCLDDLFSGLFKDELKMYFSDLCKYETITQHFSNSNISIDFFIKYLLFLLEKLNVQSLAEIFKEDPHLRYNFVIKLIEICKSNKITNTEIKQMCCKCLAIIGPTDLKAYYYNLNHTNYFKTKKLTKREFIFEKFQENDIIINQFYLVLIEDLLNQMFNNDIDLAILSNDLLRKLFQTPTAFIFLQEYETLSKDYETQISKSKTSNEETIDYFLEYIKPFCIKKPKALEIELKEVNRHTIECIDREDLWLPKNKSYEKWLTELCVSLIKSGFLDDELFIICAEIFEKKPSLCEISFPFIINKLIETKDKLLIKCISLNLRKCFELVYQAKMNKTDEIPIEGIKRILDAIEFIRIEYIRKTNKSTFWENELWTRLDYIHIANVALLCDLPYTSLYFIEIWYNDQLKQSNYNLNCNDLFKEKPILIDLLIKSYQIIGENEAISENLLFLNSILNKKINSINETNEFNLLFNYDNRLFRNTNENKNEDKYNLINSLKNCGLNYLLDKHLLNSKSDIIDAKLDDLKYSCALKLQNWDLETDFNDNELTFNKLYYQTVNTFLNEKNSKHKLNTLYIKTQNYLLDDLVSTNNLETIMINFYNLEQIKTCSNLDINNYDVLNQSLFSIDEKINDFNLIDSVYNNRILLLKSFIHKINPASCKITESIISLYEELIDNAILHKRYQIGELYVNEMKMLNLNEYSNLVVNYKHVLLLYEKSEYINAKLLIKHAIDSINLSNNKNNKSLIEYYIKCLNLYASVLDKIKCENPNRIIENYLELSINLINEHKITNKTIETGSYYKLAKFTDLQLQQINNFIKSNTFEQKQDLLKKLKLESKEIEKLEPDSKLYLILRKQLDIDEKELKLLNQDKELYLCKSIENYLNCLEFGNDYDVHIFRLISLWTQNYTNLNVNKIIKKRIFKIHTYKFIPLMYQLAARMKITNDDLFYETLIELIYQMAKDHPYHVMPIIFALSNAYKDDNFNAVPASTTNSNARKSTKKTAAQQQQKTDEDVLIGEERLNAARYLIDKVTKTKHSELIKSMNSLFDSYIELANHNVEQHKKTIRQQIQIPKNLLINQIKNFKNIPVLTNELIVNKDANYDNITFIVKFESTFSLVGGINLPKIITCLGSDGVYRKQLVKSRDDTRQDAIMQQMFGMVNELLKKNTETNKRRLTIRRYKVIPLSQKSGVIEWCDGTIPLGEWLVGDSGGAHKKYNPDDWLFSECRKRLHAASDPTNKKSRYDTYLEICKNFKPVLRHFFTENYLESSIWYQNRLNYIRSVATSSIVGYVVGLGDRHVQNILIDKNTAEVVHIDLGIAFDQGKMLPTPETVPFRLTRDIVDGFGILGIDGIFTNTCEITMQLMLDSSQEIMTIFEVLLYDPLHNWSLSPKKAYMLQQKKINIENDNSINDLSSLNNSNNVINFSPLSSGSNDTNKIAEHILNRLRQKLQGFENGVQLSCKGQVNLLIEEAKNPENLSRLYAGWQPYL